jgi:Fe-S cluster assembly protein SufD
MTEAAFNHVLFDEAVNAMPQDALSELRRSAAAEFTDSGFPTIQHEDWRYTNLSRAVSVSNVWLANLAASPEYSTNQAAAIRSAIDAHWILIQNGRINLDTSKLPDGISISRLSEQGADWDTGNIAVDDAMAQLNAALLADGLKVSVAPGTSIAKPIGFLFDDQATGGAVVAQSRILIEIQEGASARFVEAHLSSGDGEHFANNVVQLELSQNTTTDYVRIQQRARHHIHTAKLTAELSEAAEFRHCAFDFGGSLVRNDVIARLHGREASATLNGLYLAGDQQHIDNHTRVDHLVGPSRSSEEYRGILNRKSRCVFNGKAVVHPGADGTDASQSNHNLLLSGDAEIDTKPELEIYADEVKCSHGATVGQLDESALFYLRSRGLDEAEATQLITRAFASKVLSLLTVEASKDYMALALDERLNALIGDNRDE